MSISLDTVNEMYKRIAAISLEVERVQGRFAKEASIGESWENPFDQLSKADVIVDDVRERLTRFLVNRYHAAFCPNVDSESMHRAVKDLNEFDANKIINVLNRKFLSNKEELAYENLREEARQILRWKDRNLSPEELLRKAVHKNRFIGNTNSRYNWEDGNSRFASTLNSFETFTDLIIRNTTLFSRVAPSMIKTNGYISTSIWNKRDKFLPVTIYDYSRIFDRIRFYKNGRMDVFFETTKACFTVVAALAGERPNVWMPEAEIDVSQLFVRTNGVDRPKRVVQM